MNSTSDSFGNATVTLTFDAGTDPDIARYRCRTRSGRTHPAAASRPESGVTVAKSARNFLMVAGFVSEDGSRDGTDLSDFLVSSVQDQLSRVSGVGEVTIFGSPVRDARLARSRQAHQFRPHPGDVTSAIEAQNSRSRQVSSAARRRCQGGASLPRSLPRAG